MIKLKLYISLPDEATGNNVACSKSTISKSGRISRKVDYHALHEGKFKSKNIICILEKLPE